MIDYYALLSLPLAAGLQQVFEKSKVRAMVFGSIVFLLISLNLFQTWQYKNGLIHYDDMSKEAYFKGFFQTKPSLEWADLLKPYDWERRINGLPQIEYSSEFLQEVKHEVYLRGSNMMYVGVNSKAQNAMGALSKEPSESGKFYLECKGDKIFTVHSKEGLFWSLKAQYENAITASETNITPTETFTIEYLEENDNKIAIKASNGKYVSIGDKWPFILKADADKIGKNETFRYFVLGK